MCKNICVFRFFLVPLQRLWLFINKKEVFMNVGGKIITILSTLAVVALVVFVYVKFFFVYSQGVNEGDINYFQYEGFVFKTYEGKMIQTGYNSRNSNATIQSNEFKFSVEDEQVAKQIESSSSRQIKLHWKRYLGVLPWRGNSQYVVDSVVYVQPINQPVLPVVEDSLVLPIE
jgi:uncharacterized membrane protein